jgi:NitT/TauT family transport system permease protein
MSEKIRRLIKLLIFFSGLLLIWHLLYVLEFWPKWLFPSPFQVLYTLFKGFAKGIFIWGMIISLKRIFLGFGFSLITGTILGFSIAKVRILKETVGFLLLGLQTLPSICWLPLALLWFGLNEKAITFVVIMGAILSITISVEAAVRNIPPSFINIGRVLGAKGFALYRNVILPAILPNYITGIKQGWSFAWRSLMSGEMLFITVGLGQLLMFGRELNDMSQVMAVMLVIISLGVIFDYFIFGSIEKRLRRKWGL